ncbi:hypothetical protein OC842_003584 [Tilletia horrida]|uniref:Uncharacterized protein n=1 Tax=Tilletia horrida TaxID=155126 RepID=A0AAN6JL14_9BASI|nr:hypothetical protein OC842_003584 [Tilletia horrida]KAK0558307.1 hypothetical protein OC844_005253 [Tilletia horrida]
MAASTPASQTQSGPTILSLASVLLAHGLTSTSLRVESALSHTHDSIQNGVHALLSTVEGQGRQAAAPSSGKGKDRRQEKKGAAVVLFCPSSSPRLQQLTTALALSLASVPPGPPTSTPTQPAPAYTVLVLLTSADQLAPLLTAWAEQKAAIEAEQRWCDLEEAWMEEEDGERIPVGRWTYAAQGNRVGRRDQTPPDEVLFRGESNADWAARGLDQAQTARYSVYEDEDAAEDYMSGFYLSHPWHFLAYMLPGPMRVGLGWGVRLSLDLADRLGLSGYERTEQQKEARRGRSRGTGATAPEPTAIKAPETSTTEPGAAPADTTARRSRTRSIAQDVVELGMGMMKGIRIGSTSPSMPWSGTFPLPSLSPERRYPRSEAEGSVAGGFGSSYFFGQRKPSGSSAAEAEGRGWAFQWAGGLSFHVSTPWWSNLNASAAAAAGRRRRHQGGRRERSPLSTAASDKKRKERQKRKATFAQRAQIGSVIPILVEGDEAETRARESIQAYCDAHNLLCSGLVVLPSELDAQFDPRKQDGRAQHALAQAPPTYSQSTAQALLPIANALLPQLSRDSGRVVALELAEAEGLLRVASGQNRKKATAAGTRKRNRAHAARFNREHIYIDGMAAQRRLDGLWSEVEDAASRSTSTQASASGLSTVQHRPGRYPNQSARQQEVDWSRSWALLQMEETGTAWTRMLWLGKVAGTALMEKARKPVRKVRGLAGWLLDVWDSETGVVSEGAGKVKVCRVRVASLAVWPSPNLPQAPASLLAQLYPDPSQPWPPSIRKLMAVYLRLRSKVVPTSRQIVYFLGANAFDAALGAKLRRRQRLQQLRAVPGEAASAGGPATTSVDPKTVEPAAGPPAPDAATEGSPSTGDQAGTTTASPKQALPPPEPAPPTLAPVPLLAYPIRAALGDEWARSRYNLGLGVGAEAVLPGWMKVIGEWVLYQLV